MAARAVVRSRSSASSSTTPAFCSAAGQARDLPVQAEQQHVEVAHRAERAAQPTQLRSQVVRPGGVQQRPRGLQRGPHPAYGDPHLVEVLDVLAGAGAGLVREQGPQALVE